MIYVIEEKNIDKLKKDYKKGFTYKVLMEKYKITYNEIVSTVRKHKWKRKSNKHITHKGNKNAVGNKGGAAPKGNKNAVTTGAYENLLNTVFSEDERELYESTIEDEKKILEKEINLLDIRKFRMLKRIEDLKNKASEMTVVKITKKIGDREGTTTEVENVIAQIQRIEVALTQIQESKRRYMETLKKIEQNKKLEGNASQVILVDDVNE